jgi:hypothetical protein
VTALDSTLKQIEAVLDMSALAEEIADLEQQASAPNLWDDQDAAQKVTSRLSFLQQEHRRVLALRQRVDDLPVLIELAQDEDDAASLAEAAREVEVLQTEISELEVRTLLSGEYDEREALVTIRAEAGGVDAADFAEMLLRMYSCATGRTARLSHGGLRHLVRGGGRHEVRDLRGQGAFRLRHAVRRTGHASPRADLPVRQPGPSPDLLRGRRGDAGHREDRPHRHPRGRVARRRIPLVRPRRAVVSTPPTPRCASPTCRPASS